MQPTNVDVQKLVTELNFAEKVKRSLALIQEAYQEHGEGLVFAHSMGKDSTVVWDLCKRSSRNILAFAVTTRFKPYKTKRFMFEEMQRHPEIQIFQNEAPIAEELYKTDPNECCRLLKVIPVKNALEKMKATCWVTGLRCTEGRTRTDYQEVEERDKGLIKLNPILLWTETEVWKYIALRSLPVNPLYLEGFRSLGCTPCTSISNEPDERAGRWRDTSKCGGECGIHTNPLKGD